MTCTDPDGFVIWGGGGGAAGPNLSFFEFVKEERIKIPVKAAHHRPTGETHVADDDGPMMAFHCMPIFFSFLFFFFGGGGGDLEQY